MNVFNELMFDIANCTQVLQIGPKASRLNIRTQLYCLIDTLIKQTASLSLTSLITLIMEVLIPPCTHTCTARWWAAAAALMG